MQSESFSRNGDLRRKLLGTASALALLGLSQFPGAARAGDMGDAPISITVDVAAQYTMAGGDKTAFGDPSGPIPLVGLHDGGDGLVAVNFARDDGWVAGISVNFGRTGTSHGAFSYFSSSGPSSYYAGSGEVSHHELHQIVDFTVGREVGLGMFGLDGNSAVSIGIEWANFSATTVGDFSYSYKYDFSGPFTTNFRMTTKRRFHGIGPVISWNASTPICDPSSHLSFNWGAMASVLFGTRSVTSDDPDGDFTNRSEDATVPRLSGYLGVGWHPMGDASQISVGFAASAAWGVFEGSFEDSRFNVNRFGYGPYVDFTYKAL